MKKPRTACFPPDLYVFGVFEACGAAGRSAAMCEAVEFLSWVLPLTRSFGIARQTRRDDRGFADHVQRPKTDVDVGAPLG